jgi:hypothetical protein
MRHRLYWFAITLASILGCRGCSSELPRPLVITQAAPNVILGVKRYVVAPLTWNGKQGDICYFDADCCGDSCNLENNVCN